MAALARASSVLGSGLEIRQTRDRELLREFLDSDRLFAAGVFAQGIAFPTVARDKGRVRTIVTAAHTRADLEQALDIFASVGRAMELI